jgi:23S rRNA (pseudouridine1915-N3)-methyltransferase
MIRLICFGRLNSNPALAQLFAYYYKMLSYKLEVIELEVKRKLVATELKQAEAELIFNKIAPGQLNIILQEYGTEYTSQEFSKFILNQTSKHKIVNFIISGAYGFADSVQQKADISLSLSKMTFPHLFARVLLIEQLYRAGSIQNNHPYHK